jgi:hypothetical protein
MEQSGSSGWKAFCVLAGIVLSIGVGLFSGSLLLSTSVGLIASVLIPMALDSAASDGEADDWTGLGAFPERLAR